jgi:hypothetical protein
MPDDEDLLVALRSLFARLDPMDPRLLEQAHSALTWRTVDAELAELSFDSLVDHDLLAARSDQDGTLAPRMLGFRTVVNGEEMSIDVEVVADGGGALVGQLVPPRPASIEVQTSSGTVGQVEADELGRFEVESVPRGPVRLLVRRGDRVVQTTWVSYLGG